MNRRFLRQLAERFASGLEYGRSQLPSNWILWIRCSCKVSSADLRKDTKWIHQGGGNGSPHAVVGAVCEKETG